MNKYKIESTSDCELKIILEINVKEGVLKSMLKKGAFAYDSYKKNVSDTFIELPKEFKLATQSAVNTIMRYILKDVKRENIIIITKWDVNKLLFFMHDMIVKIEIKGFYVKVIE